MIPLHPKRAIGDELLLCKWDSGNIINHSKKRDNTSSKLIELTFENAESFTDTTQRYGRHKPNCIPYPLLSKDLATDSKCFSDSAVKKTTQNVFLSKLKRPTNSFTCTLPSISNVNKKQNDQIVTDSKVRDSCKQTIDNISGMITDDLVEVNSESNLLKNDLDPRKVHQKIISEVVRNQIKEIKNCGEKSDENLIKRSLHNFIAELNFIPTTGIGNNESTLAPPNYKSETNDIYDELGILFSHYLKLQSQPCERKYCPLKRHLKQQVRHSTQKCQRRFSYYQIYPYDQRPTCNSGNVCEDTYDELKLMCTPSAERRRVYYYMFQRRKHFLNQPYRMYNQNSTTTEHKIKQ
ncbi:uncharacterized protein LOC108628503 isoform X2 [Ceratina calcarata]|nr:uncharacterized protein LOC108628503 isoform X2 [Ceratina calcarata]